MGKNSLTVVMYHYVRDLQNSRYPRIKGLDVRLFKEQLLFLKKHYHFVTIEEIVAAFYEQHQLPEHAVLLTFDDAYADHFTYVFPLLDEMGVQGAFYPPVKAITEHTVLDVNKIHFILASTPEEQMPNLIKEIASLLNQYREAYPLRTFDEYYAKLAHANRFDTKDVIFIKRLLQVELEEELRCKITNELFMKVVGMDEAAFSRELYMSIDQIKCMARNGMHIGSHGYDHYWLGALPKDKQAFEIKKSFEFIRKEIGRVDISCCLSMCYPYGSYDKNTIELMKEYGCKLGFTTQVDIVRDFSGIDAPYTLPRLDTNDLPKEANAVINQWYEG